MPRKLLMRIYSCFWEGLLEFGIAIIVITHSYVQRFHLHVFRFIGLNSKFVWKMIFAVLIFMVLYIAICYGICVFASVNYDCPIPCQKLSLSYVDMHVLIKEWIDFWQIQKLSLLCQLLMEDRLKSFVYKDYVYCMSLCK